MPLFAYRAKKGPQEIVSGTIDAVTQEAAIDALSDQGLLPVSVEPVSAEKAAQQAPAPAAKTRSASAAPPPPTVKRVALFGRVRSGEITIFSRQLASLLKAGVPILRGLGIIAEQSANPRFRKLMESIQDKIRNGETLSATLAGYPKLFPPIYLAMVRTGEGGGTLQETLLRVSDYRQRQEEIWSRVRSALAYPILMALTGIGTVLFMFTFVIPKLSGLFTSLGSNLPMPTRILMAISDALSRREPWIAVGAVVFAVLIAVRIKPELSLRLWSRVSLKAPVLGDFMMKAEMARFARTLELLIQSGTPILRAIEITAPVLSNAILRDEMKHILEELAGGGSFGKSLAKSRTFPLFMTNLISVGEESGKLDEAMAEISRFYERETDEAIRVMTSLLEPLMILVMGLIVGFIVIAMMLPMFELSLAIK